MDVSHLIDPLNDAQREPKEVPPWAVLAVTFTNKAAGEMRARLDALIPGSTQGLTVGTFHGIAHRLLRRHWREAGLTETFQILDSDDQLRLVKRVVAGLGLDDDAPAVIAMELTDNHEMVIPIFAVCLLARAAASLFCPTPVYKDFAERMVQDFDGQKG
ncbi:MAG: hypothetical protein WDW36_004059 [Sanguina aurantia]